MSERNETRKGTSMEDIAREAYSIFQQNGSQHGHDIEDWLEAERRLSASDAEPQADGDSRPVEDDSKPRPKSSRRRAAPPVSPQKPNSQEIGTRH